MLWICSKLSAGQLYISQHAHLTVICFLLKLSHANSENASERQTVIGNTTSSETALIFQLSELRWQREVFFEFQIIINNQAVRSAQVIIKMILQMPSNENKLIIWAGLAPVVSQADSSHEYLF